MPSGLHFCYHAAMRYVEGVVQWPKCLCIGLLLGNSWYHQQISKAFLSCLSNDPIRLIALRAFESKNKMTKGVEIGWAMLVYVQITKEANAQNLQI